MGLYGPLWASGGCGSVERFAGKSPATPRVRRVLTAAAPVYPVDDRPPLWCFFATMNSPKKTAKKGGFPLLDTKIVLLTGYLTQKAITAGVSAVLTV